MNLDATQLIADAERATGLADWGGEEYFEPAFRTLFGAMADSLDREAQLHAQGRRGAILRLQALVEARLQFIADRKRWPGIAAEKIVAPIVILGLPRAGSTFLHSLLAQDPANHGPLSWEMMFPSPPPEPASYADDPRIERVHSILEAMGLQQPEVVALHPFGARAPEECHLLMELMALGDNLNALWRMPGYARARATVDLRQGYLTHRFGLQNLQFRNPAARWVLKNPGHVFHLEHLLAVYPDARIVQTHRDPAKVIPSVAALLLAMRRSASDQPFSPEKIARGNLQAFATGLERAIEYRERPGMDARFIDVHFCELIADPIGTVRTVYAGFDLPLDELALERMRQWLASDRSHTAKAKFTLAEFGLDEAQIDAAFGRYMTHYGIARERAVLNET